MWGSATGPSGGYIPDLLAQFLSRVVPWSTTQPPDGFTNIHAFGGTGRVPYRGGGNAYASLAEYGDLKNFVDYLNRIGAEVFFCLSQQARIKDMRGTARRAARSAEQAVSARSFVLDLDIKKGRYATQRAALAALLAFCDELGLELGPIVSSGTGIHAYFTLDEALDPLTWRSIAGQLRAAATDKGILFDAKVTTAVEHLLRLPTSTNHKDPNNPRLCSVLSMGVVTSRAKFQKSLEAWPPVVVTRGVTTANSRLPALDPSVFPPRRPIVSGPDVVRVRAALERSQVVTDHHHLHRACAVFADSYDRAGDGDPEPLWYTLAKLCHYVEHGRDLFHDLSSGDERYDEDATDQKYDIVSKDGWPSCQTIGSTCGDAAALCNRCAFNGQGNSPLHYAIRGLNSTPGGAPPSVPYVNGSPVVVVMPFGSASATSGILMPPGYIHTNEHMIVRIEDNAPVFNTPVYELDLVSARVSGGDQRLMMIRAVVGHGLLNTSDRNEFLFSLKALAGPARLMEATFEGGLTFKDVALAKGYLMDWQTQVREQGKTSNHDRMGWTPAGFTFGGYTFTGTGWVPSGISKSLQQLYTPNGKLDLWRQAASHLIGHGYVELEMLIAASFAAPLISFTPEDGAIVFGRSSQSGVGKSAALNVAASVWGSRWSVMQLSTTNAIFSRIAALNNLPVILDELVPDSRTTKAFNEIVMAVSGGKEKARLDRSANDRPFRTWRTLMLAAANHSLVQASSGNESNAQAVRVFEFPVPNRFNGSALARSDITGIRQALEDNCGTAGFAYAQYIGAHRSEVAKAVASLMDLFEQRLHARDDERFWIAVAATIITGASIAKKIGLLQFDIPALWAFCEATIRQQRTVVKDMGVNVDDPATHLGRLSQFLNEHIRNQIHTERVPQQGANRYSGKQQVLNAMHIEHSNFFVARIAKIDMKMLVSKSRLEDWFKHKGYNFRQMMDVLRKEKLCTDSIFKRSLGAQANLMTQPTAERVLEFDLAKPELGGFLPP